MKKLLGILLALSLLAGVAHAQQPVVVLGGEFGATATPAVTNASYAIGNALGSISSYSLARTAAGSGFIQSFWAVSPTGQTPSLDIFFFNANPTGSTCTDKVNFALAAADIPKFIGFTQIIGGWVQAGTPSVAQSTQLALPFKLPAGQLLWACVVTRTIFIPGSTTDFTYGIVAALD